MFRGCRLAVPPSLLPATDAILRPMIDLVSSRRRAHWQDAHSVWDPSHHSTGQQPQALNCISRSQRATESTYGVSLPSLHKDLLRQARAVAIQATLQAARGVSGCCDLFVHLRGWPHASWPRCSALVRTKIEIIEVPSLSAACQQAAVRPRPCFLCVRHVHDMPNLF